MGFQDRDYVRAKKLDYDGDTGKTKFRQKKQKAYYGPDKYGNYPGGEKKRLPDWMITVGLFLMGFLVVLFGWHWR